MPFHGDSASGLELFLRALALEDPSELPPDASDQSDQVFVRRHLDGREEFQHGHDFAPDRDGKSESALHADVIDEFGPWKVGVGLYVFDPRRFAGGQDSPRQPYTDGKAGPLGDVFER